jgi:acetylornithine deacetylase/succinyl-diaminopimelate desuccinylase-like protein
MQALTSALTALGEPVSEPIAWETSCDARLYHAAGHPVAIFGAGKLASAHSDDESVDIPDIQRALAVSTLATWSMTR